MASPVVSPLEFFVKSFIRTHVRRTVPTRNIDASITLCDLKLTKPEGTQLILPVNQKGILSDAVLGYLNAMSTHRYRDSIIRSRALLNAYKNS